MNLNYKLCGLIVLLGVTEALTISAASAVLQSKTDAGYILEIEGKWYLEKKPKEYLGLGQRLSSGDVIRIISPTANDHIVISSPSGDLIKRYCNDHRNCGPRLIVPPPAQNEPSVFEVILQTAMRLIRGTPERYSVHGVRGVANDLEEAVCRLDQGTLDLTPAFHNMPKGSYYLRLRSLRPEGPKTALGPIKFEWSAQTRSSLLVPGVTPGLYEIKIFVRAGDEYEPTSLTGWVLVANAREFDLKTDSFRPAVALASQWGKGVADENKRQVLRAYLDNLAAAK